MSWPELCAAFAAWGIDSPLSMIGCIGTTAKESASTFLPVREAYWLTPAQREAFYADTTKHAPYGGGTKYHGRGFVQTTHRSNYEKVQHELALRGVHVDLVNSPDLLLEARYAAPAMAIYWVDRGLVGACEQRDWGLVRVRVFGAADADGTARIQRAANLLIPLARARGFL